jgi:hypothetical protein
MAVVGNSDVETTLAPLLLYESTQSGWRHRKSEFRELKIALAVQITKQSDEVKGFTK